MIKVPSAVHPDCREFVMVVEELLEGCQRAAASAEATAGWRTDDWGPRTWTRQEFQDAVYGSYKPMRQGRVTRPPRREIVMEIADYLNCTLPERNRLLVAAHAPPIAPYLTGPQLDEVLQVAGEVAGNLPIPAIIINRDWRIHFINGHALTLIGISLEQVAAIPLERLNILHLLFDPDLPLYAHLIHNRASWNRMARQTIYGFKLANLLCQQEPWYQKLIQQLMALPAFEQHWRTVNVAAAFDADPSAQTQPASVVVETVVPAEAGRARLRPLLISVGYFQFDFPQIVAFLPADEPSRETLRSMGIPAPATLAAINPA